MEIGRQGMVGNGHTSRVGKEMEQRSQMADIRDTGISLFSWKVKVRAGMPVLLKRLGYWVLNLSALPFYISPNWFRKFLAAYLSYP